MNPYVILKAALCAAVLLAGGGRSQARDLVSAPAWGLGPFSRPDRINPIISPAGEATFDCPLTGKPVRWESTHTFNPTAVVKDGKVWLLYRAEDDSGTKIGSFTSRLGLATSEDGLRFTPQPTPVFFPTHDAQEGNEWPGGCEDPRLVEGPDGTFVLMYTQWNRRAIHLAVATSRDLMHWEKHGPAFAAALGGKYKDLGAKSGAVVCAVQDGRLQAVKIGGKYWMYWGEGDIQLAWSENLLDWTIVEDAATGKPLKVIPARAGHFESVLAEAGPSPILTEKGILVLYNGKNAAGEAGDPFLAPGAYAGGQALFDRNDPTKMLERTETPFFQPEAAFEKSGQYVQGTTFLEGLVFFQNKWMLYYGCADSFVAVAVNDPRAN